jgi:hypothetical protein
MLSSYPTMLSEGEKSLPASMRQLPPLIVYGGLRKENEGHSFFVGERKFPRVHNVYSSPRHIIPITATTRTSVGPS